MVLQAQHVSAVAALQAQLDGTQQSCASEKTAAETAMSEATAVFEQRLQQLSCRHAKVLSLSRMTIDQTSHFMVYLGTRT